jgi:site-specific DNA recombinase
MNTLSKYEGDIYRPSNAQPLDQLIAGAKPFMLLVARVSDESQRPALPGQRKRLVEYAEKIGGDYAYCEFDESAYMNKVRAEFASKVLEPLKTIKALVIVTFDKVDRFSRDSSSEEKSLLTKMMRQAQIELHFPHDNLYIHKQSPASDLFHLDVNVALAGYYSSAIRDNVKRRFDQKLADGEWPGKAPIGYTNYTVSIDSRGKRITDIASADNDTRQLIKLAFEMRAAGVSYGAITSKLQILGMKSAIKNKPIPKTQVTHIIENPFYMGEMRYEGKLYPHKYEPIIDVWLWKKVQEVNMRRSKYRTKSVAKEYIYKGLIRCETCGYTVFCDGPKNGGNFYVKCTEYGGKHNAKWINEKLLNAQIVSVLESIRIPEAMVPKLVEQLQAEFDSEQDYYKQQVKSLQSQYERLDAEIKDMFRELPSFKNKRELFEEIIEEKVKLQGDILEQIKDHSKGNEHFIVAASKIYEVASQASQMFLDANVRPSVKRRLLEFALSNMTLEGEKLIFELKTPFDVIAECSKISNWGE